jgi:hypothetical protein
MRPPHLVVASENMSSTPLYPRVYEGLSILSIPHLQAQRLHWLILFTEHLHPGDTPNLYIHNTSHHHFQQALLTWRLQVRVRAQLLSTPGSMRAFHPLYHALVGSMSPLAHVIY